MGVNKISAYAYLMMERDICERSFVRKQDQLRAAGEYLTEDEKREASEYFKRVTPIEIEADDEYYKVPEAITGASGGPVEAAPHG